MLNVGDKIILFTHEIHACKINNNFYNKNGVIDQKALSNYLHFCNKGLLLARCVEEVEQESGASYLKINNESIKVAPLKEFTPTTIFPNIFSVLGNIKKADSYLIRLPGLTGTFVGLILYFLRKSYGVELAGDLEEGLHEVYRNPGLVKRLLFKLFRNINAFLIAKAVAVAYRSELLKRKYPNAKSENEFVFSGAQIFAQDVGKPKPLPHYETEDFLISALGRLSPEKGIDNLIEAIALINKRSAKKVRLEVIGDGIQRTRLQELIHSLKVEDSVTLLGKITDKHKIHEVIDRSQLFIIPSLTEGMPRALIEAMARGAAALGANVGGIPELLDPKYLFEPRSAEAIAIKVLNLIDDQQQLVAMSEQNFAKSKEHWTESIKLVKDSFWSKVCQVKL